jgi:hypothetical protein
VLAAIADLRLPQEDNASRLQLLCELRDIATGLIDSVTVRAGAGRGFIDIGCAIGDGGNEVRCLDGALRQLAGRCGLLRDRGGDAAEQRTNGADHVGDFLDGSDRCAGVVLQRRDAAFDFFRRALRLQRQRFHFRGDDGEAAAGLSGARRFDGGIQGEQIGLPCDVGDEIDDSADLRR